MFARSLNSSNAMCCVVAGPTLAFGQLPRLCPRRLDEIRQRVKRRDGVDDDDLRRVREPHDGRKARQRIVVQFLEERMNDERIGGDQNGAAVRRGTRNEFGADDRSRARAIFDHGRDAVAAHLLRQHANEKVGAAAGGVWNDESDGSRRLRHGPGAKRNGAAQCSDSEAAMQEISARNPARHHVDEYSISFFLRLTETSPADWG